MVATAYTIIDPWTVVVESLHTPIADGAVAGSRRPQHLTVGAHLTGMYMSEYVQEVMARFQKARIQAGGYCPTKEHQCAKSAYQIE